VAEPADPADQTRRRTPSGAGDATQHRPGTATVGRAATSQEATGRRVGKTIERSVDPSELMGANPSQRPGSEASMAGGPPGEGWLMPGAVIRHRYLLESLIGSGGMGQVWKAKDLVSEQARDPNPFVAIKLLNADFEANADAFVALQRETKKAQELAHPNVITVFAFDVDDAGSGRAFMSMELLHGQTVDALIRSHAEGLSRKEALPLIVGMAKGLEYAHKKGIVHSDFKPGNVFVTSSGVPKVLDFGIARAAAAGSGEQPVDSFDAGVLGALTPLYASPGMIENTEPQAADDVYALGLVAYELLTGAPPFGRLTAVEARDAKKTPHRIGSIRGYEWRAICRALEFDSRKRWQNAGEFLRAFEGKSVAALVLGVLAVVLFLTAGAFWYQAQTAAGPSMPLEALSAADQAAFHEHMATADGEWRLVQQGNGDESLNAAQEYARAYDLHPRDPLATAGLAKSADYTIARLQQVQDPVLRLKELKALQDFSDFYRTYRPLTAAIRKMDRAE
jgi:Protein kinase domain